MHSSFFLAAAIAAAVTTVNAAAVCARNVTDTTANLTVAMIRSAPPNWPMPLLTYNWTGVQLNISETVDEGINLIQEAADAGAGLVTFPELWFPGYVEYSAFSHQFLIFEKSLK